LIPQTYGTINPGTAKKFCTKARETIYAFFAELPEQIRLADTGNSVVLRSI